jgi:uncharacterized membrane protein
MPSALPLVACAPIVFIGTLLWLTPQLTRPDLYFAVTVDPAFPRTPEGREIRRRYRLGVAAVAGLGLAAVLLLSFARPDPRTSALVSVAAFYLVVITSFVVFLRARRSVLPHAAAPTSIREAALDGRRRIVPGGWPVAVGPFIVLAGTAAYLWRGPGDAGASRELLAGAVPVVIIAVVLYGIGHWVRAVYVGGALGAGEVRFRRTVATVLLAIQYAAALQWSFVALLRHDQGFGAGKGIEIAIGLIPLAIVVAGTIALARLGQGGSAAAHAAAGPPVGDRTADRYWRLGIFYVNRDDPALFVERRFGLGYTLNFGHAVSWLILLVPLALAAAAPLVR